MSNFDFDGTSENDWDERGDLAWNEFDWERYLREQEETVHRYLAFYETFKGHVERVDEVARHMGWEEGRLLGEDSSPDADDDAGIDASGDDFGPDADIYTLHKNPIYIATKALYLRIRRPWELLAIDPHQVPQSLAVSYLASLHHGEDQAMQAIHALEFGDFAMAISLLKRALSALNRTLALLSENGTHRLRAVADYRGDALSCIFDLREIWLRVIAECRSEIGRSVEEEDS